MAGQSNSGAPAPPTNHGGTANKVPEMIKQFQAAKAKGKFTYNAGRMDHIVNAGVAVGFLVAIYMSGKGIHQLAYNYGKRD